MSESQPAVSSQVPAARRSHHGGCRSDREQIATRAFDEFRYQPGVGHSAGVGSAGSVFIAGNVAQLRFDADACLSSELGDQLDVLDVVLEREG